MRHASSGTPPTPTTPEEALYDLYAESLRAVAEHARRTAPGLAVRTELLCGSPGRVLARTARDASMLVVAAHGFGGYGQPGVGPVSGYVARHASAPVVVVRAPGERGPEGPADVTAYGPVVVGVRDADEATAALKFAFEEAALHGVGLVAVHAWYWFPPALLSYPFRSTAVVSFLTAGQASGAGTAVSRRDLLDARALSAEAGQRLAAMLDGWHGRYPEVPVSHQVVHGHPGHVLAELTGDAGLLVLGRHHHRDGLRPGAGSIQYTVLAQARGPVVLVPSA